MVNRTGEVDFLSNAKLSAAYHHERWDGLGYPYGIKETDIPLHGRIMAIVDVYDALTSDRPYKKAFSNDEAVSIIMDGAGKHFDPKIAEVFFEIKNQFEVARVKLSRKATT
jgi:putative two-component system response regulator